LDKSGKLLEAIKFEHSIFALPFAYLGMILAARGLPTLHQFIWITVAMVAARTTAMAANRVIDRHIDAANPRTAQRALPTGSLSVAEMSGLTLVGVVVTLFAAWQLNDLCLKLSPLALIIIVGYSYTKRFTWTSHYILGVADGLAPIGGWMAVSGTLPWEAILIGLAVATWIAGFDIIYACQDIGFDQHNGLHSIPAHFGLVQALRFSTLTHILTIALLIAVGVATGISLAHYVGVALAAALLIYEHRLVRPDDLSKLGMAFMNVNGYIAVIVFVCTFTAVMVRWP
jgi:4-hydroxybenzoate polyprenyltransferase